MISLVDHALDGRQIKRGTTGGHHKRNDVQAAKDNARLERLVEVLSKLLAQDLVNPRTQRCFQLVVISVGQVQGKRHPQVGCVTILSLSTALTFATQGRQLNILEIHFALQLSAQAKRTLVSTVRGFRRGSSFAGRLLGRRRIGGGGARSLCFGLCRCRGRCRSRRRGRCRCRSRRRGRCRSRCRSSGWFRGLDNT